MENIIINTLYTFRVNYVFTTDICFGLILPVMYFIFDIQEEWTWNISNNHIIKSNVCMKLKYIQVSLDISQYISYHAKAKKRKKLAYIITIKTQQMPNKWQYLTCIKVSFANENLQSDLMKSRL